MGEIFRLTHERQERGWSRSELARRANLHPSQISQFELGHFDPYDSQLLKLAQALEFTEAPRRLMDRCPGEVRHRHFACHRRRCRRCKWAFVGTSPRAAYCSDHCRRLKDTPQLLIPH